MTNESNTHKEIEIFATHAREPFFELAAKYVTKDDRVLDVGAGHGYFRNVIAPAEYFAVEGNPESAEKLRADGVEVAEVIIPSTFPWPDGYFQVVHCSHLVEHLQASQLIDLLKEFDRVLDSGGKLIISAPLHWDGFHNDLSHVRPYSPTVFKNYLCDTKGQRTASAISNNFEEIDLQYRYRRKKLTGLHFHGEKTFAKLTGMILTKLLGNITFAYYDKSGFTTVLMKS